MNGSHYTMLKDVDFDNVEELAETYNSRLFSGRIRKKLAFLHELLRHIYMCCDVVKKTLIK